MDILCSQHRHAKSIVIKSVFVQWLEGDSQDYWDVPYGQSLHPTKEPRVDTDRQTHRKHRNPQGGADLETSDLESRPTRDSQTLVPSASEREVLCWLAPIVLERYAALSKDQIAETGVQIVPNHVLRYGMNRKDAKSTPAVSTACLLHDSLAFEEGGQCTDRTPQRCGSGCIVHRSFPKH